MKASRLLAFAVGPVAAAGVSALTVPLMAWWFTPEDVGRYSLFVLATGLLATLMCLGLHHSYLRDYAETAPPQRPGLLRAVLLPCLAMLTLLAPVMVLSAPWSIPLLFGLESWLLAGCLLVAAGAETLTRFLHVPLRMEEQAWAHSLGVVLAKLLLLLLLPVLWLTHRTTLDDLVLAAIMAGLVALGWNLAVTRTHWSPALQPQAEPPLLGPLLRYGFPMQISAILFWLLTASGALFLRAFSDFEALGVYAVTMSLAGVATVLNNIMSSVWSPQVYKWAASGGGLQQVNVAVERGLLAIVTFVALVGSLAWTSRFLLPAHYDAVQYLWVAALGHPLLHMYAQITAIGVQLQRRSDLTLLSVAAGVVVQALIALALVPTWGAAGALVSLNAGSLVFFIVRTECSMRIWRPFSRWKLYGVTTALTGAASAMALWGAQVGAPVFAAWALAGTIMLALLWRCRDTSPPPHFC